MRSHCCQTRLESGQFSTIMSGLMASLLATIRQERDTARSMMVTLADGRDPEISFYLARHLWMLGARSEAIDMFKKYERAATGLLRHLPLVTTRRLRSCGRIRSLSRR